jgi:hypothetical protein
MKLFDILKENALRAFASNTNINVNVGPDSTDEELIKEIQKALQLHSLALVDRVEGQMWPNDKKAWAGAVDGVFSPQLQQAISVWQQSINRQIEDMVIEGAPRLLTVNGVINKEDGKLLLAPLTSSGFLQNRTLESALKNFEAIRRGFEGQSFANADVAKVTDFASFIQSIGRDGWFAILTPIANQRFMGDQGEKKMGLMRDWADDSADSIMNKSRNADILFDNLRAIMRPGPPIMAAPTKQGEVKIIPEFQRLKELQIGYLGPLGKNEQLNKPKLLFLHFASIAMFQMQRAVDTLQAKAEKQDQEDAKSLQNDTATIDDMSMRRLAEKMRDAFDNNYWAIFTSARVESDEIAVEEILMQLSNAKDYDALSKAFSQLTGNNLSMRLALELPEDLYKKIFISHLLRIRRISPRLYHSQIQFGDEVAFVTTGPTSDKQFSIASEMTGQRPTITPVIYDIILEDAFLKKAIVDSGGTIPDLYRAPTEEERVQVVLQFVQVMNSTYPEMTRFYAHLEPFDDYSPIGPLRLKGIVEEATVYVSAGTDARTFITRKIKEDREWLVGTGEDLDDDGEADGGAANIYFSPRYQTEGLENRPFSLEANEEEVNLDPDAGSIIEDLGSEKPDIIEAAILRIFAEGKPAKYYQDTIYKGYKQMWGSFIEYDLGGTGPDSWTESYYNGVTGDNPYMDKLLINMARVKGNVSPLEVIAFVAPYGVAQVFDKALNDSDLFLGIIGNIDEELIEKLVTSLSSREDFDLVDFYYEGNLQQDIESKDAYSFWGPDLYAQLVAKIGISEQERTEEQNTQLLIDGEGALVPLALDSFRQLNSIRGFDPEQDEEKFNKIVDELNLDGLLTQLESIADESPEDESLILAIEALTPTLLPNLVALPLAIRSIPNFDDLQERFKTLYEKVMR